MGDTTWAKTITNIYVASSWLNIYQPTVVDICRTEGFKVYDFRNPKIGNNGFRWTAIDPEYKSWDFQCYRSALHHPFDPKSWDFQRYRSALHHPVAEEGFRLDMDAIKACDACLLVMPSGRSAALEVGFAAGAGKRTAVLYPTDISYPTGLEAMKVFGHHLLRTAPCSACGDLDGCWLPGKMHRDFEPELMVKMTERILIGQAELGFWLADLKR